MRREVDDVDRERMELEAERMERIRDYVPAEDFDPTTAQTIARLEIGPYVHPIQ